MRAWVLVGLLLVARSADAATIHVPADQPTLAAALTAANPGDEIVVAPGDYSGAGFQDLFVDKDVLIRSSGGPMVTSFGCGFGAGRGLTFAPYVAAMLDGFTIRGCEPSIGEGGGILFQGSMAWVRNCIIEFNTAQNGGGVAMVTPPQDSSAVLLDHVVLHSNSAYGPGGTVLVRGGFMELRNVTVVDDAFNIDTITVEAGNGSAQLSMVNSIVWALPGERGPIVLEDAGAGFSAFYSDIRGGTGALWGDSTAIANATAMANWGSNINVDPQFTEPGMFDFTPLPGSPVINAGDPLAPLDPDGSGADMGAIPFYVARCGNRAPDPGEDCDDGNTAGGDGCSAACLAELPDGGQPDSGAPTCGDGMYHEATEECDDGNTDDFDGCSAFCAIERCGDGFTQPPREECDDENQSSGDGCDENCLLELPDGGLPFPVCGDEVLFEGVEQCDDGNLLSNDGCSNECQIERCGDTIFQPPREECEDGNTMPGDGCDPDCLVEIPDAGPPPPVCGDGTLVMPFEECDDGNLVLNDGCSNECRIERCGDSIFQPPREQCEDGNTMPGDGCDGLCLVEVPDAGLPDAAMPDAARPDAAMPDAAMPDAAMPDAAMPDAAMPDAAMPDAAVAVITDAGKETLIARDEGLGGGGLLGCAQSNAAPVWLVGLVLLWRRRRA